MVKQKYISNFDGKCKSLTTSGTWSKDDNSSWSSTEVLGWTWSNEDAHELLLYNLATTNRSVKLIKSSATSTTVEKWKKNRKSNQRGGGGLKSITKHWIKQHLESAFYLCLIYEFDINQF